MALVALPARPAASNSTEDVPNRRFICNWPGCNKAYVRRGILRNHIAAEHEQIILTCSDCSTNFRYNNDLKQHKKRIHQNLRPYVCQVDDQNQYGCACGRSFATSSELYRHQRAITAKQSRSRACVPQATSKSRESLSKHTDAYPVTDAGRQIATVCYAPARAGALDDLEQTMIAIRDYVAGSFQSGRWTIESHTGESWNRTALYRHSDSYDSFEAVGIALVNGNYDVACTQLNRACQTARISIQTDDPDFLTSMIFQSLDTINRHEKHRSFLIHSHNLRARYLHGLSQRIHGPQHPWTLIMRLLAEPTAHASYKDGILIILRVLRASYRKSLDADSVGLLRLMIGTAVYFEDASEQLQHFMEHCTTVLGRFHELSRFCFDSLLYALWAEGQFQSLRNELDVAARALEEELDGAEDLVIDAHLFYWRYYLAAFEGEWYRAADIMNVELIPRYIGLYGEDSAFLVRWFLRLEHALELSGQLGRLQEAKENRYARMERIAAKVAEEDHVQELKWLASRN